MAFKPNYNQQRAERNRAKQAKKDAKLREQEEATARRKAGEPEPGEHEAGGLEASGQASGGQEANAPAETEAAEPPAERN